MKRHESWVTKDVPFRFASRLAQLDAAREVGQSFIASGRSSMGDVESRCHRFGAFGPAIEVPGDYEHWAARGEALVSVTVGQDAELEEYARSRVGVVFESIGPLR